MVDNAVMTGRARLLLVAAALLGAAPVLAQAPTTDWREFRRRADETKRVLARAHEVRPVRRDEPLRDVNITDDEIREIQHLVRNVLPRSIVNIGPVITGCPCEEGTACTEQVYVQASSATRSVGLLLSRTANRWGIGRIQTWWMAWESLEARRDEPERPDIEDRRWALIQDFPVCTREASTADNATVPFRPEPSQ